MSATFLHRGADTSSGDRDRTAQAPPDPIRLIDWRAARLASRACCCPARPAVIAVIPPAPGRRSPVDLLLCGHHYRKSRAALAAIGATLLDIDGGRLTASEWPEDRSG